MIKQLWEKCMALLQKHREIVAYLIVGVLTTIVSWVACFLAETMGLDADISWQNGLINTIGWVAGVIFGYVTNRRYVFHSTNPRIWREFAQFSGARISTLFLDIAVMYVTVNMFGMDYWVAKIGISAVLVTVANYVFSKLFVFKKDKV